MAGCCRQGTLPTAWRCEGANTAGRGNGAQAARETRPIRRQKRLQRRRLISAAPTRPSAFTRDGATRAPSHIAIAHIGLCLIYKITNNRLADLTPQIACPCRLARGSVALQCESNSRLQMGGSIQWTVLISEGLDRTSFCYCRRQVQFWVLLPDSFFRGLQFWSQGRYLRFFRRRSCSMRILAFLGESQSSSYASASTKSVI
jgi:hypothetical protein